MSKIQTIAVSLDFFARPLVAAAYIFRVLFVSALGIGAMFFGLQELSRIMLTPQTGGGMQWFLWMVGFCLCLGVVLFDICVLTQISVENGVIYEHRKFIRQPKKTFTIRELQEVIARKYHEKGSLFSVMSLDLRFKDEVLNKNEWIIALPLSTSQEEAEQFASKINRMIQADSRSIKTPRAQEKH